MVTINRNVIIGGFSNVSTLAKVCNTIFDWSGLERDLEIAARAKQTLLTKEGLHHLLFNLKASGKLADVDFQRIDQDGTVGFLIGLKNPELLGGEIPELLELIHSSSNCRIRCSDDNCVSLDLLIEDNTLLDY